MLVGPGEVAGLLGWDRSTLPVVRQQHGTRREGARLEQAQVVGVDPVAEQVLATAQDHREEDDPELIDQVAREQEVDQVGAAVGDEVAARLRLEPRDLLAGVAAKDGRVRPVGLLERLRDDVFRRAVDEVLQSARLGPGGPEGGPDVVRGPAEEERLRAERLLPVVVLELLVGHLHRPAVPPVPVLLEAGRLHDPVEGHELGDDQSHRGYVGAAAPRPCPVRSPGR